MSRDDLDKVEAWFLSWFVRMQIRTDWPQIRPSASDLMDEVTLWIHQERTGAPIKLLSYESCDGNLKT